MAALRRPGSSVEVGVAADEVAEQLAPYLKHRRTGRPWVVLKLAATLDGRIGRAGRDSRWITGEEARARRAPPPGPLRRRARRRGHGAGRRPRAHGPHSSRRPPASRCGWCSGRAPQGARVRPGARAERATSAGSSTTSGGAGCSQLLVEGGATVAHDFHAAGLVDRYVLYLAPAFMGG